jgi:ribosomal protein S27E
MKPPTVTVVYACPTCGHRQPIHVTPTRTPTCAHWGTVFDARKPSEMKRETE